MKREHVREKPHNRKQYDYTSTTFSDALQIHMMTHTGEKPHKFDPYFGVLTSLPFLAIFGKKKMIIFGRLESVKTTVSCLLLQSLIW